MNWFINRFENNKKIIINSWPSQNLATVRKDSSSRRDAVVFRNCLTAPLSSDLEKKCVWGFGRWVADFYRLEEMLI